MLSVIIEPMITSSAAIITFLFSNLLMLRSVLIKSRILKALPALSSTSPYAHPCAVPA